MAALILRCAAEGTPSPLIYDKILKNKEMKVWTEPKILKTGNL
jgi:hypothetical protein